MFDFALYHRSQAVLVFMLGLFLFAGCGGGGGSVEIKQVSRSPAIEDASADIVSPKEGTVLDKADVSVVVEAKNFETGIQTETERADSIANSGNGQHFHMILDNQPYMANYEAGAPFKIEGLEPGAHTLITFPSRSYHESVKGPGAYTFPNFYGGYDFTTFYVKEETDEPMLNDQDPAIVYSRPKGTYSGSGADRILLDFYLHNVELSKDGYKAKYTIQSADSGNELASATFTKWAPGYVKGLSPGTYEVNLTLLDADGNVVDGPFNDTTREITVEE